MLYGAVATVVVLLIAGLAFLAVSTANSEQDKYDACWARGGVQVKTVKFSNGAVCIDRSAIIKNEGAR